MSCDTGPGCMSIGEVEDMRKDYERGIAEMQETIDWHAARLEWATELLVACYPAVRHHYKQGIILAAIPLPHERYLRDDDPESVCYYQRYKEIRSFLDLDPPDEPGEGPEVMGYR